MGRPRLQPTSNGSVDDRLAFLIIIYLRQVCDVRSIVYQRNCLSVHLHYLKNNTTIFVHVKDYIGALGRRSVPCPLPVWE